MGAVGVTTVPGGTPGGMKHKSQTNIGQYSLTELKVTCRNLDSLELKKLNRLKFNSYALSHTLLIVLAFSNKHLNNKTATIKANSYILLNSAIPVNNWQHTNWENEMPSHTFGCLNVVYSLL